MFFPDCYETKQLCDKVVITYPCALIFFPEWLKPQETCDKTVDASRFLFNSVLDQYITEELCSKVVSKESFLLKYLQDSRNVWHCCWWFATSIKICFIFVYYKYVIEKLAVFSNYDIVFGDFKSDFFAFFSNDKDFNIVTLDNINLDDNYFDGFDPETNHVTLMGWCNKFKQAQACKKR